MANQGGKNSRRGNRGITLVRSLSLVQTTFLGVGTAFCGTIFVVMGKSIDIAGPGVIITFLLGSIIAFFHSLTYAELGAAIPSSAGGGINFVRKAFGDTVPTFLTGWFDWMGSITDCAVGAIVFGYSINYFLGWVEPFTLAVATLVIFAAINFRGVKITGITEFILTAVLIVLLGLFMAGSTLSFDLRRFDPFLPKGILPTAFLIGYIFPTYAGYETITQLSEEVKTAGKNVPRALFLTIFIITILFLGIALALIGGAPLDVYTKSETPLHDAANYFMGPIGGIIVAMGSIIAALSTINGSMAGAARIAFALGRNNLLPPIFAKVHPKNRSPYTAVTMTAVLTIVFVLTRSVDFIVYALALGYIVTSIFVGLALLRLRTKEPYLYRPFKVPLYPYVPIIAIAQSIFMLITLSLDSLALGFVFAIVGLSLLKLTRRFQNKGSKVS